MYSSRMRTACLLTVSRGVCLMAGRGVRIQIGQIPPWTERPTDRRKNITFPQLRLRTVIKHFLLCVMNWDTGKQPSIILISNPKAGRYKRWLAVMSMTLVYMHSAHLKIGNSIHAMMTSCTNLPELPYSIKFNTKTPA